MKATGCVNRIPNCGFPKDPYADITPISVDENLNFVYQVEWDSHYRNHPLTTRTRHLCIACGVIADKFVIDLIAESHAIDKYYGRRDSEYRSRARNAQHQAGC